jgi:cell division protein FtsI/penicillin-binding protein 2
MAAAIDSNSVSLNETCNLCAGPRTIADYTIQTWNEKYYPDSSMSDIIVHSDNVGMVYVAEKLGVNRFFDYLQKFGLLQKTNIDLQGEVSGKILPKTDWHSIDLATASFGQGIAFTPIQVLSAVSSIANKGEIFQPQVVAKVQELKPIEIKPISAFRPISAKTAGIITQMMVEAVEKGEAKWAKPKGYQIAGKTGTAQIPIAGHYDPEKTIASFVGFAPAENPAFVMLVTLNEPKTSVWGSETAAPLWFSIAQDIFRLKKIAPNQ